MPLLQTNVWLRKPVAQALHSRPELKRSRTLTAAALAEKDGATYSPLIPSITAQVFGGGLGHNLERIGAQEDYFVGLTWRIGPGGLFDYTRRDAATARFNQTQLGAEMLRDRVVLQVVESFTCPESLAGQIDLAKRSLAAAEEGLKLSRQRQEFAVGVVLENIIAEQDLSLARTDYLRAVTEFNKALYALNHAMGKL